MTRAASGAQSVPPVVVALDRGSINKVTGTRSTDLTLPGTNLCFLLAADSALSSFPAPRQVWLKVVSSAGLTPRHEAYASSTISTTVTAGMPCRFEMVSQGLEVLHTVSLLSHRSDECGAKLCNTPCFHSSGCNRCVVVMVPHH